MDICYYIWWVTSYSIIITDKESSSVQYLSIKLPARHTETTDNAKDYFIYRRCNGMFCNRQVDSSGRQVGSGEQKKIRTSVDTAPTSLNVYQMIESSRVLIHFCPRNSSVAVLEAV